MTDERRTWDAEAYRRISRPQQQWGEAILSQIALTGDETAIDAGCGTGTLTRRLAEALPRGRVIALDVSPAMLAVARRELADLAPRVDVREADLSRLTIDGEADLIFSAATFHWVLDQDALYRNLYRALKPGGRLHAQCGGTGNLQRLLTRASVLIESRWAGAVSGWRYPVYFAGVDETLARLEAAGFADGQVTLVEAATPFDGADAFREFVEKVVIAPVLQRLPSDAARRALLDHLVTLAADDPMPYTLDYVRLNIQATR